MEQPGEWVDAGRRERPAGSIQGRRGVAARVATVAVAVLFTSSFGLVAAGAQGEPEPTTPTTESPTTEPPTTLPPTTAPPTTEPPTTLPPTTEAPQPTSPPTTSGGGGGTVRPTVPATVATTEPPSTATTAPRSTVVAPVPGAVTVPEEQPAVVEDETGGPWLSPDTQLRLAVGGLGALAVVMVALTVAYWRHTRPGRSAPLVGLDDSAGTPEGSPEVVGGEDRGEDESGAPGGQGADDRLGFEPTGVSGDVATSPVAPTTAPGYSAAPPSALPPPSLGLRSVPTPKPGRDPEG